MNNILQPGNSFVSPDFDENNTRNYRLSIGLSLDGFSFLVQEDDEKILMLNTVRFNPEAETEEVAVALGKFLDEYTWIKQLMKRKVALADTGRFTLIPFSLYEDAKRKLYLNLNHPVNDDDVIKTDMLNEHHSYLVYAVNKKLYEAVNMTVPGLYWFHYASKLVNCTGRNTQPCVYADVRDQRFYVLAFSGSRLKFCNEFRFRGKEDFAYFVLLTYKQLKLNPDIVPLRISGLMDKNSDIDRLLHRYVRNIDYGDDTIIYQDKEDDNEFYVYHFLNLKNAVV